MMTLKTIAQASLATLMLIAGSCASTSGQSEVTPVQGKDFELRVVDNLSKAQFELEFLSRSDREICISQGQWPASENDLSPTSQLRLGSLSFMSDRVYVLSEGRRIPIKTSNFGYCLPPDDEPNACSIIVESGARLTGVIPYKEFDGEISASPTVERRLIYGFAPYFCE